MNTFRLSGKFDFYLSIAHDKGLCALVKRCKHTLNKLEYDSISNLRHFQSLDEKNKYIALLKRELREINKIDIENKSKKVYGIKKSFPDSILAKRCLDFEALEKAAMNYE